MEEKDDGISNSFAHDLQSDSVIVSQVVVVTTMSALCVVIGLRYRSSHQLPIRNDDSCASQLKILLSYRQLLNVREATLEAFFSGVSPMTDRP